MSDDEFEKKFKEYMGKVKHQVTNLEGVQHLSDQEVNNMCKHTTGTVKQKVNIFKKGTARAPFFTCYQACAH